MAETGLLLQEERLVVEHLLQLFSGRLTRLIPISRVFFYLKLYIDLETCRRKSWWKEALRVIDVEAVEEEGDLARKAASMRVSNDTDDKGVLV